jgi:riboflavin synthase
MFTGIVEELGLVRESTPGRLSVACRPLLEGSEVGSSVGVNGVCLTVVARDERGLSFDLTRETLGRTALARLQAGDPVNLERPVTLTTRLGGHLVQGHVDGVGAVEAVDAAHGGVAMSVRVPGDLARYLVDKGSVTVEGVSLTVVSVHGPTISVALTPHTLAVTTLGRVRPGDPVNVEVDVIAKYVERMAGPRPSPDGSDP